MRMILSTPRSHVCRAPPEPHTRAKGLSSLSERSRCNHTTLAALVVAAIRDCCAMGLVVGYPT
jgi:hypothetical protein